MIEKQGLIGKHAEVTYNGRLFAGTILDETKNMITLDTGIKAVRLIKKNTTIRIGEEIIIGKKIIKRPEDRIKGR